MKNVLHCLAIILLLTSCWKEKHEEVLGYAPVYGSDTELKSILLTAAQPIESGGKIYVYDKMLYQVETGKGIHITDISNPASPEKKGFLKVPGAQELAIKDKLVFTNNMKDLVIVKIVNNTATIVRRLPDTFKNLFNHSVPPERGKFECPDPTKGAVIGWQKKKLLNPACSY